MTELPTQLQPPAKPAEAPKVAPPAPVAPKPVPPPAAAPAPPKPTPPAAAAQPAPPPPVAPAPRASTSGSNLIKEVRLQAPGIDVAATEPGAHELGRDKAAGLRVNHPTVSRQHARIIISDDRGVAYLQDRGGANGTRLNGTTIKEIQLLKDGDTISIGDVELKVAIRRG
jgi:pSer/pThr/pTyr-binding forkhead associated (FHA) protein